MTARIEQETSQPKGSGWSDPISKRELVKATLTLEDWFGGGMSRAMTNYYAEYLGNDILANMNDDETITYYRENEPNLLVSETEARDYAVKRERGKQAVADKWQKYKEQGA
jgi:hypothetical protein